MARLSPIPGSRRPFTEVSPLRFPVQADPILQVSAWLIILFTEYSPAPPFQVRSESRFLKFVRNFRDGLYYSIINVLGFPVPPPRLLLSPVPRDSFDILARLFFIVNNFFRLLKNFFHFLVSVAEHGWRGAIDKGFFPSELPLFKLLPAIFRSLPAFHVHNDCHRSVSDCLCHNRSRWKHSHTP